MSRAVRIVLATVALGVAALLAQATAMTVDAGLWWWAAGAAFGMWAAVAVTLQLITPSRRDGTR